MPPPLRCRGPRRLHRRGDPDRGRPRGRHKRPLEARPVHRRAREGRGRRRRQALDRRRSGAARPVRREAAACSRPTTPTGAACRCAAGSRPTSAPPRIRGRHDPRRPDAGHRRMALRRVRREPEGHRRQLPPDDRRWRRPSPTACAAPGARRVSPARPCRTTSASPTAPAGRSWATPATTRTHHRAGHHGRLPRRRALRRGLDAVPLRNPAVRRGDGRVPRRATGG